MGKALTKTECDAIQKATKPNERLIEATLTIRWLTTDDLETAATELKTFTNQFKSNDRIRGYLDIGFKKV